MCQCYPSTKDGYHYVQWMGTYFRSCHYTPVQRAAFFFGLANIGWWLFAQFPQFILNFFQGNVEGLSFLFIFQWLLGDITNLLGAILTQQLPIQLYTAIYFCVMDLLLVLQYAFYRTRNKYFKRWKWNAGNGHHHHRWSDEEDDDEKQSILTINRDDGGSSSSTSSIVRSYGIFLFFGIIMVGFGGQLLIAASTTMMGDVDGGGGGGGGRVLLEDHHHDDCEAKAHVSEVAAIIGDICAWVSGVLYFFARWPQIIQNYRRKTTKGLSFFLFVCTMMGNTCYGLSIILQGIDFNEKFWRSTAAYLLGSICVVALSMFIVLQMAYYDWIPKVYSSWLRRGENDETLDDDDDDDDG